MTTEQLFLQLGIAGAILFVGYRVALVFIDRWAKVEDRKTTALETGFKSIVDKLDAHTQLDISSHTAMAATFIQMSGGINERFARLEGVISRHAARHDARLEAIMNNLDMTPAPQQPPRPRPRAQSPLPENLVKDGDK